MEARRIDFASAPFTLIQEKPAPVPASPTANPVDTARAEVNAACLMTAMMQPSADGIYAIGAVAVKVTNAIKAVAKIPWSSWGF